MDVVKTPESRPPHHHRPGTQGACRPCTSGHLIADSGDVLMLKEASYKAMAYFPRQDVEMGFLAATHLDTYCPYKGHASYFTLTMDGKDRRERRVDVREPAPGHGDDQGPPRLPIQNFVEVYMVGGQGAAGRGRAAHRLWRRRLPRASTGAPRPDNPPV